MIKKKSLALLIYTLYFEINKGLYHSKVHSIIQRSSLRQHVRYKFDLV